MRGGGSTKQRAVRSICLFNHPWRHRLLAPLAIHNVTGTPAAPLCSAQTQGGAAASGAALCGSRAPLPHQGPGDPACAAGDFQGNEAEALCGGNVRTAAVAWHSHVWRLIVYVRVTLTNVLAGGAVTAFKIPSDLYQSSSAFILVFNLRLAGCVSSSGGDTKPEASSLASKRGPELFL